MLSVQESIRLEVGYDRREPCSGRMMNLSKYPFIRHKDFTQIYILSPRPESCVRFREFPTILDIYYASSRLSDAQTGGRLECDTLVAFVNGINNSSWC